MTPSARTLAALLLALGLAAPTLGGAPAWAQEATEPDDATGGDSAEAELDPEAQTGAPADASTVEGGPTEPVDAADGADEAGTDASGNTSDDPNPEADPDGGQVEATDPGPAGGTDLPVIGAPWQGGINFQPASSEVARDQQALDGMLTWIIAAITLLVMGLMGWVIVRFGERRNPTPSTFTHNSPLEVAWTVVPIILLVFIGAFSLPVLFDQQEMPEPDVRVRATGAQWFWNYEYLDEGIAFDSYMIGYGEPPMTEAADDPIRLQLEEAGFDDDLYRLATDTALVLPVDATVVMTVTGADVIHSWALPSMGVKQDAVPGRLAQAWFNTEEEGVYFGQCSELCGKDHAFMPIQVRVVSQEEYEAWLATAREEFGV